MENLLRIALLRKQAHELYLSEVQGKNEKLTFSFTEHALKVRIERIPEMLTGFGSKMTFHAKGEPYLQYSYKNAVLWRRMEKRCCTTDRAYSEKYEGFSAVIRCLIFFAERDGGNQNHQKKYGI